MFNIVVYSFVSHAFVDTRHYVALIIIDYRHSDFHCGTRLRASLIRA